LLVLIIFLFGFFNEVIIAPFIQPSRHAAATPLIVSNTVSATATPEVIIPKINVEIPVDYSQTTTDESQIENALENGVVHYPTTVLPGQNGNTAFFGHSSNNIFNKGKYKFAFVLLHELGNGDTFYLTYNSKVYAYKVISKTIVEPNNVGVLGPVPGQTATATLITCDPPGTSLHRLIVVGQQISPDPAGNSEASNSTTSSTATTNLPGNGPTLLGRVMRTTLGKAAAIIIVVAGFILTVRWVNKPKRALQL
jgi:LPXTG-site transpeptidase (sortase) family protein